ncbi:MAG: hypothetical protein ACYC5M_08300 [Anaerolineae bacterium]
MEKESGVIESITKILTDFALTKFPVQALEVKGPVKEGTSYRWRIVSTRYKQVTVVLRARKPLFKNLEMHAIEVFGTTEDRKLQPNLQDLQAYLEMAELVPTKTM